ncbi:MAG: kinase, partial [Magnetococcales bacterium]|nr:kinase [Magnetococcales bacterium]
MIISRTPFRLSFFGGGTDYPQWFHHHGGAVLATAINKYCYISARHLPPFFAHRHRIVWSQVELVKEIEEIRHPVIRSVLKEMDFQEGLEIHHEADLPARSGLGSSSTFTVGLLHTLQALRQRMTTHRELADAAIHIEQNVLAEAVGCQDQICAAFGGFNRIDFHRDGSYELTPIILPNDRLQELEGSLMLFFSGITRFASNVARKKIDNLNNRK